MTIGVIVSTYNQPHWLGLALEGWCLQHHRPDEIIIADDGSDTVTAEVIRSFQGRLPLRHVWHADDGFRKTEILNAAIAISTSDYLVFTDGDCIPRADFLAVHAHHARPGRFLSGGYHKLTLDASQAITAADVVHQRCFVRSWLAAHGQPPSRKDLKLLVKGRAATLIDQLTTTRPTWNGHNASGWRNDLLAANGFDVRMRYGGEDRELGERLENAGIRGHGIRYRAVCLHLEHGRGYVNAADLERNNAIRAETRATHRVRTEHGIDEQDLSSTSTLLDTSGHSSHYGARQENV